MGLLKSAAILAIAIIVIGGVVVLAVDVFHSASTQSVTSSQAEQFVQSDLKQANPTSNVTIINVSPSRLKAGSWTVVVSVVYNSTRPCPTFLSEEFDYPAVTLVPSVEDQYTGACQVYGLANAPSYVITAPPVAITRSYDLKNPAIMDYINTYGYNNTVVHARLGNINASSTPLGMPFNDSWLINYSSPSASDYLYVIMNMSGTQIFGTYTLNRTAG